MTAIDTLPFELLTEILSHLPAADLARTALVSRHMHDVCMPLLYQAPVLHYSGRTTNRPPLQIFLWTILTPGRESLVTHVRSLRVHWSYNQHSMSCPSKDVILNPVARRFGLRSRVKSQGAQLALLIHLLPRLRVLTIAPPVRYSRFTKHMNKRYKQLLHPTRSPPLPLVLQSLREFHSPPNQSWNGISQKTLLVLLLLPCIRVVDVQIADDDPDALCAMDTAAVGPSRVTKLCLADANGAPGYLPRVFAVAGAVTHFSYATVRCPAVFGLEAFWAALRPLRATVVSLQLHISFVEVAPVGAGAGWSLRDWAVLRKLSCSLDVFLGEDRTGSTAGLVGCLPVGIREVEVTGDSSLGHAAVVEHVLELLGRKNAVVPSLQTVAIRGVDERVLEELKGEGAAVGVAVVDRLPSW